VQLRRAHCASAIARNVQPPCAFHYRDRYRFSGAGRFAFRARVRFERAYPYVLGYSARTFVTVG
jgi:hypothetical protein